MTSTAAATLQLIAEREALGGALTDHQRAALETAGVEGHYAALVNIKQDLEGKLSAMKAATWVDRDHVTRARVADELVLVNARLRTLRDACKAERRKKYHTETPDGRIDAIEKRLNELEPKMNAIIQYFGIGEEGLVK